MNLPFSTTWPKTMAPHLAGQPTYFVEKIIYGLRKKGLIDMHTFDLFLSKYLMQDFCKSTTIPKKDKFHTIRVDQHNRWKVKNKIHFYINARTKNQFQFAPIIPCVSTQNIEIIWQDLDHYPLAVAQVYIDNVWIVGQQLQELAINDGFNTLDDFFAYFNTTFKGKIIHWTNLKY